MCQTRFEGAGADRHLRHGQQPELPPAITGQPMLHPFWAAGFSFARGHFVILVPYDQHLPMVFQGMFVVEIEVICGGLTNPRRQRFPTYTYVSISIGEEISVGLRAFTHGYDFYARTCAEISCTHVQAEFLLFMPCLIQRPPCTHTAERSVCFHMYATRLFKANRNQIHKFWENQILYQYAKWPAMKRLNSLIGMADWPESEWPQADKELYTLGHVRTINKFFNTFGIYVKEQTVEPNLCSFVQTNAMMEIFMPALRPNGMGIDYDKIDFEFVDPKKREVEE